MRRVLSVLCILVMFAIFAAAQGRGPSTPEERARVVDVVSKLQADPIGPQLRSDREWALKWVIEVPDVSVSICGDLLHPLLASKYKYSSDLIAFHTLALAAFVVSHPDQANDNAAANIGAMQATIAAYRAILQANPKASWKAMDGFVQMADSGGLESYVREQSAKCNTPAATASTK